MNCRKCKKPLPLNALYCPQCGASRTPTRRKRKRGNGQGSAYKRGRFWTAIVTLDHAPNERGKRVTKGGFPTERDAILYCPTLMREAEERLRRRPQKLTVKHYFDMWSDTALVKLSKSKQSAYKAAWKRLGPIKDAYTQDLMVKDLQALVEDLTYYPARDVKSLLSHLYKLAVADNQARLNLSELIVLPELEEKEGEAFSADEITAIWVAYRNDDRVAAYLLLMIYSSMMPGELFGCTKGMIDLKAQRIDGAGKKTTERKQAPIVIADYLVPVVERILSFTPEGSSQHIVYTDKWAFYDLYKEFKARHGIRAELPLYTCRHTTATALALEAKVETSVIKKVLRQSPKSKMPQRYIHPKIDDMLAAVNAITPPNVDNTVDNTVDNIVNNATEFDGVRGNVVPISRKKKKPENP